MTLFFDSDFPNFPEILDESNQQKFYENPLYDSLNPDENLTEQLINNRLDELESPLDKNLEQFYYSYLEKDKEPFIFEEPIKSTKENSETNPALSESESSKKSKKSKKKSKIFDISKVKKEKTKETPQFLGKKRQAENHSKFAFDNLVRKIKSKLFGSILIILNKSLESNEKGKEMTPNDPQKVKKGEVSYECFLKPDQKIILQTNVKENLALLDSKLRDIFSENVSTKVKNFSKEYQLGYNKNFIERIKNDEKKKKTNDILDMTFFQCMEHFRGTNKYEALAGLEKEYEKVVEELSEDEEYLKSFEWQLNNFEDLYKNKRARNRNSNKKKISADDEIYYMQI